MKIVAFSANRPCIISYNQRQRQLELCIQVGQLETTVVSRLVLFPVVSGVFFAILLLRLWPASYEM